MKDLIVNAATDIFGSFMGEFSNDIFGAAKNAARDGFESLITGKRSIEEWAEIAVQGVDEIKGNISEKEKQQYVGGNLNFTLSDPKSNKVVISFELYFLDGTDKWHKVTGDSDLSASNFVPEALEEIRTKGKVSFEVEG